MPGIFEIKKPNVNKPRFARKHYFAVVVSALVAISGMIAYSDIGNAQSAVGLDRSRARVARSEAGHPLTPASRNGPEGVVVGYLRGLSSEETSNSLRVKGTNLGAYGVTHVRMEQEIDGLAVHGAYVKAAVNADGELIHLIDRLYSAGSVTPSRIDAPQALAAAMARLYPAEAYSFRSRDVRGNTTSFDGGAFFYREPTVTAVALPMDDGTLTRGWVVETWTAKTNELYHTVVDGAGRVLDIESRTAQDSYNVYSEDPGKGPQTVVTGPGGWLSSGSQSTINIVGPNARAYLDADANNAPDAGGTAVTDGNFLTAANLTAAPTTTGNRAVAVQNLFYLNNVAHDVLYSYGFDEAAGNFQGSDPVNAEAQDGGGVDNANFATPADGSSPRMQMYLWTGYAPDAQVTVNSVDYGALASAFGTAPTVTGITGPLQSMNTTDGCVAAPAGSLTGKVALIARGNCDFTVKVLNAQNAGAVAAVITNNVEGNPITPGGTNRKIKIPSAMVTKADGDMLRTQLGASARLRKYTATALQIDGDLDADIVFHEYGHGLTWRMIGGMSGKLAGAIGEGAADVNAFLINGDDRIGEYAYSNSLGIRRYPYSNYPLTYKAVDGAEVHNDGEIYAGAMWRVLQNYLAAGLTAEDLHGDFVDGMNYTPSTPAFEDMRDGMLASVAGSGRECLIWRGFAASGIGVGADGMVGRRAVSITESFTVPASCTP